MQKLGSKIGVGIFLLFIDSYSFSCDSMGLRIFLDHLRKSGTQNTSIEQNLFLNLRNSQAIKSSTKYKKQDEVVILLNSNDLFEKSVFDSARVISEKVNLKASKLWRVFETVLKTGEYQLSDQTLELFHSEFAESAIRKSFRVDSQSKIARNLIESLRGWVQSQPLMPKDITYEYFAKSLREIVLGNFSENPSAVVYRDYLNLLARFMDFQLLGQRTFAYPEEFFKLLQDAEELRKVVSSHFPEKSKFSSRKKWYFVSEAVFLDAPAKAASIFSDIFQIHNWIAGAEQAEELVFVSLNNLDRLNEESFFPDADSLFTELYFTKYTRFLLQMGQGQGVLERRNLDAWIIFKIAIDGRRLFPGLHSILQREPKALVQKSDLVFAESYEKFLRESAAILHSQVKPMDREFLFESGTSGAEEFQKILNSLKDVIGKKRILYKEFSQNS